MTTPLRAGLVGLGSLSQRGVLPHLSQPDARARLRLEAVVDVVEERARQTAARYEVPRWFTDMDAMLAEVELDLVLVITPIAQHYEQAMKAIRAGRHVYVQKAMAVTLAEADALLAARDAAGVKLAAAPGFELFPTTAAIREAARGGEIGQVGVAYTYTMGFGHEHEPIRAQEGALAAIDPSWYYRPGAGPLPDVTVYALQLATSVLGPARRVTAFANRLMPERTWRDRRISIEVADNNLLLIEFASGALCTAVGSDVRGGARAPWGALELYGTRGALEVTDVDQASGYPLRFTVRGAGRREHVSALADQPYLTGEHLRIEEPHVYCDIMDLVDAIAEGRPPRASGEQARHVVEIIEAAHRAAATGVAQQLTSTF
ncbi:MAG TPA: Gfo/Idh/MocA family oxidoreductase [Roseiflexaceae bacterium]|nr:Gfo/Idh/MocA family oxidoreductase [Roseiflexaceae bacterium]